MAKRNPLILSGLLAAASASPSLSLAARLPQTAPLDGVYLFISPCGKPYRSTSGQPYPVVAWFNEADANRDGKLDRAEMEAEARSFFQVLDRNGDGVIDDQEISYYEHNIVPEINAGVESSAFDAGASHPMLIPIQVGGGVDPGGGGGDADGKPPKTDEKNQPRQGAAIYGLLNDPEPVRSADRSLESRITLPDFVARADHNFDRLDYDGRGYLTLDDLPRTPAQAEETPAKRSKA